jgi:hypothetical protein
MPPTFGIEIMNSHLSFYGSQRGFSTQSPEQLELAVVMSTLRSLPRCFRTIVASNRWC